MSSDEQKEAEIFWDNPVWWLTSKILTIGGAVMPLAAICLLLRRLSISDFDLSGWYIEFLGFALIFTAPLVILNYYKEKFVSNINSILSVTDSLCGKYVVNYLRKAIVSIILTVVSTAIYWKLTEDDTVFVLVALHAFVVLGYYLVISIRAKYHLFGLNSVESEELLDFLYANNDEGSPPTRRIHVPSLIAEEAFAADRNLSAAKG